MEVVTYDPLAMTNNSEIVLQINTDTVKYSVRLGFPPRINPIETYREVSEGLQLVLKFKHCLFIRISEKKVRVGRTPTYVVPGGQVLASDIGYINDHTVVISKGSAAYRSLVENRPQKLVCDIGRTTQILIDAIRDRLPAGVSIGVAGSSRNFTIQGAKGGICLDGFTTFSSALCMQNTVHGIIGTFPTMTMRIPPAVDCPLSALYATFSLRRVYENTPLCRILRANEDIEVNLKPGLYDCAEIANAIEMATSKKIICRPIHGGVNMSSVNQFSVIGYEQTCNKNNLTVLRGFEKHGINNATVPIVDKNGLPVSQFGFSMSKVGDHILYEHSHTLVSAVPHRSQRPSTTVFDVWKLMNESGTCYSGAKVPKSKVCTLCSLHHLEILYLGTQVKEIKLGSRSGGTSTEIFLH